MTDFVSFLRVHYPPPPVDCDPNNSLQLLRCLLDEVERDTGEDCGNACSVLMDFVAGDQKLKASAQQNQMTPVWMNDSSGHTCAQLRRHTHANSAMEDAYWEALGRKWISSSKINKALEIVRTIQVREEGETVVCLETALAAKFDATIHEAVGDVAIPRPAALEGLEKLPQRVRVVPNNAAAVKEIIRETLDQ